MTAKIRCPQCNGWVTIEHFGLFKATVTRETNLQVIRPDKCSKCDFRFVKPIIEWALYFRE